MVSHRYVLEHAGWGIRTTATVCLVSSGNIPFSFFNKTIDSRAAFIKSIGTRRAYLAHCYHFYINLTYLQCKRLMGIRTNDLRRERRVETLCLLSLAQHPQWAVTALQIQVTNECTSLPREAYELSSGWSNSPWSCIKLSLLWCL